MRKIDEAFSDSLKAPGDVIPIQDVLLVSVEPVARYRPHAILAIRDNAYLSFRASPPLSCYRLNVLFGTAILVPDDREHFALLSVRLDPPRNDLQTGSVRRTPTFDESSIDANDHLLGRFIRFSILGNFPLNLFVDALSNRVDPASDCGMGSSAHRWEQHSQQSRSLAIRNLRSQAHLQMTQLGRHSTREDFRNRAPNLCAGAALTTSISRNPEAYGPQDGIQPSAAEVFDRPLPATSETFPPLFTMLVQLLLYHGVLQPIRNLLRFLQIDSKVFRSRTPGDPFDGAQCNRGLFTVFSNALHYDVPAHVSSWFSLTRQRTIKGEFRSRPPGSFRSLLIVDQMKGANGLRFTCKSLRFTCNLLCN